MFISWKYTNRRKQFSLFLYNLNIYCKFKLFILNILFFNIIFEIDYITSKLSSNYILHKQNLYVRQCYRISMQKKKNYLCKILNVLIFIFHILKRKTQLKEFSCANFFNLIFFSEKLKKILSIQTFLQLLNLQMYTM